MTNKLLDATLASLDATLASRWPIHKNRYIFADRMYEESLRQTCRGICAHCGETFDGTFLTEKQWFKAHDCVAA